MNNTTVKILAIWIALNSATALGQTDTERPEPPVLNLVTVKPETGKTDLKWTKSPSSDVAGYIISYYLEFPNIGYFQFDTIFDPNATTYSNLGSFAEFRIESYVVTAIDKAGNVSPYSNLLNTIYPASRLDTCNRRITINWNSYPSSPFKVKNYHIFASKDGEQYSDIASVGSTATSYTTEEFSTDSRYCFYIMAELEGGASSYSSKTCLETRMQRPPDWINADYASVNTNNEIDLSFTVDPLSEIKTFSIDRKLSSDPEFTRLAMKEPVNGKITYTDNEADIENNYQYRLSAVNNCGNPVEYSNISGNIVLRINENEGIIEFRWNQYQGWRGNTESQQLFINTGSGFVKSRNLLPSDTLYIIDYKDIMYDITTSEACFYIKAIEGSNIFNIKGESNSNIVCTDISERITVPTAFTPDNDLVNDLFRPVLSFTPQSYRLIITDRKNNILLETTDYLSEWDGTKGGSMQPEGVYLWYLKAKSPSGRSFSKSGTVTIIRNR